MSIDISKVILEAYPKAIDCINGHIGVFVSDTIDIQSDEEIVHESITRCSHCGLVLQPTKIEVIYVE